MMAQGELLIVNGGLLLDADGNLLLEGETPCPCYIRAGPCPGTRDSDSVEKWILQSSVSDGDVYKYGDHDCLRIDFDTALLPCVPAGGMEITTGDFGDKLDSCSDCDVVLYVQGLDCDDDTPLDVWAPLLDIDAEKFYAIGGTCVKFVGTTSATPGTVYAPGEAFDSCEACVPNDCPSSNDPDANFNLGLVFEWPAALLALPEASELALSATVQPTGTGGWSGLVFPDTLDEVTTAAITCDGKWWYLTYTTNTLCGGVTFRWRMRRLTAVPNTQPEWEYVDESHTCCADVHCVGSPRAFTE